jgi:hypothetical protein
LIPGLSVIQLCAMPSAKTCAPASCVSEVLWVKKIYNECRQRTQPRGDYSGHQ